MSFFTPLNSVSYVSNLLPPVLTILYWRRLDGSQRSVGILISILCVLEAVNFIFFMPARRNNYLLFWSYTLFEFSLVALAYYFAFTSSVLRRRTLWLIGIFDVLAIIDIVWILGPTDVNSVARSVETLILVVLALLYLRQLLDELRVERLSHHPMFWLTVGVLLYFPGTLLLFATTNWFSANLPKSIAFELWQLNYVANIIFNLFVSLALWFPADRRASATVALTPPGLS